MAALGILSEPLGDQRPLTCYRVSLISGSLEVTACLKSTNDLELLVKVLEANKSLFPKADPLATDVLILNQEAKDSDPVPAQANPQSLKRHFKREGE